ncbi:hypothetical protein FE257_003446 [Aspergillus nanangensis]|uniref:BTB domain-containing protein n=1 Tax=Aspergillus nanangensis TaxID=2582783 RepID=A0AAD4CBZ5_ASPNN|nr:hypothetical protein FE257_003446 [Aspergillus nanangensis]
MDTPEVLVAGIEATTNSTTTQHPDVPMSSTPNADAANGQPTETPDITLPDATAELPDSKPAEGPVAPKRNPGIQFLEFLTSPIVEILVGEGQDQTVLTAHQTLLVESPFLASFVEKFGQTSPRRIELPHENVEAFGYFLQYQYTRDYSPAIYSTEKEAVVGEIDDSGEQLLKHARVYTLAEKLGIPSLKSLAHSKIHRINSTSHGEIAYARYVYTHTPVDDKTIRKPVASFWASRSYVLRHEAEEEFKKLCLDVPVFCFDVLSLVLDWKEKRTQSDIESGVKGSGRKRLRSGV